MLDILKSLDTLDESYTVDTGVLSGSKLNEAFSSSMPDWVRDGLTKSKTWAHSDEYLTTVSIKDLLDFGIDPSSAEFIEVPREDFPKTSRDPRFKLPYICFILLEFDASYPNTKALYVSTICEYLDNKFKVGYPTRWDSAYFKRIPKSWIIQHMTNFCYVKVEDTDIINKKRLGRADRKRGSIERNRSYGLRYTPNGWTHRPGQRYSWNPSDELASKYHVPKYDKNGYEIDFNKVYAKLQKFKKSSAQSKIQKIQEELRKAQPLIFNIMSLNLDVRSSSRDQIEEVSDALTSYKNILIRLKTITDELLRANTQEEMDRFIEERYEYIDSTYSNAKKLNSRLEELQTYELE